MANIYDFSKPAETKKFIKVDKLTVAIKTVLTADEYASAVNLIINSCFGKDGYVPEYKELAKRYAYLKYFTDIDLSDIMANELYELSQTGWYDKIMSEIVNVSAYQDVELAVEEAIAVRQNGFDKLCRDLSAIITNGQKENLADISKLLDKLGAVDKEAFVKEALNQAVKAGDKNGGEKS